MSFRYDAVVELIRKRVAAGTLKPGDRLPSIRQLGLVTGFSTTTILHGYELLESQGLCIARERSGYYLTNTPMLLDHFPTSEEGSTAEPVMVRDLPPDLLLTWRTNKREAFGSPAPCKDLYDSTALDKCVSRMLRRPRTELPPTLEGDELLRLEIAKRAAQRGLLTRPDTVLLTGSAMQSFNLCLDAFTEPGDVVLVESPSYFPILSAIKRRNLRVIEIYSHPRFGIDHQQFDYLVSKNAIKVALIMANNHYPTGVTYDEDTMRSLVQSAARNDVVVIENDIFGELSYGSTGAPSLKQYDRDDVVIQFSSFEHSLSPEYGIGWVLAGKHVQRLAAASYLGDYASPDWRKQRAIAEYLATHSMDRELRRVRDTLRARMDFGLHLLANHLDNGGVSVSAPTGGYMCWVRGPSRLAMTGIASALRRYDVGILPGPVFSAASSFENFCALNLSFPWTDDNRQRLIEFAQAISGGAEDEGVPQEPGSAGSNA